MQKLIAIGALRYASRDMEDGTEFDAASDSDAHVLIAAGKARAADGDQAQADKPKRYNRRDLRAKE